MIQVLFSIELPQTKIINSGIMAQCPSLVIFLFSKLFSCIWWLLIFITLIFLKGLNPSKMCQANCERRISLILLVDNGCRHIGQNMCWIRICRMGNSLSNIKFKTQKILTKLESSTSSLMCGLTRWMRSLSGLLHGTVPFGKAYTREPSFVVLLDTSEESIRWRLALGSLAADAGGGTGMFKSWKQINFILKLSSTEYKLPHKLVQTCHSIMLYDCLRNMYALWLSIKIWRKPERKKQ